MWTVRSRIRCTALRRLMLMPNGRIAGEGAKVTVDGVVRIPPASAAQVNRAEMCFVTVDWAQVAS